MTAASKQQQRPEPDPNDWGLDDLEDFEGGDDIDDLLAGFENLGKPR
jgi:hypothetical protein